LGGAIAYPSVDIDAALETVIVMAALAAESLCAFIYRRVVNRG